MPHLPSRLEATDAKPAPFADRLPPRAAAPLLISGQQIKFSTAVVLHGHVRPRRRVTTLIAALGRIRSTLLEPRPHSPRHEPAYFETARMWREMSRL